MTMGTAAAVVVVAAIYMAVLAGTRKRRRPFAGGAGIVARERDMAAIAIYHGLSGRSGIDARTWSDLDLDAVFARIDFTRSAPGRQRLYDRLRSTVTDADVAALEAAIATASDREAQLAPVLGRLDDARAYYLPHLFFGELPPRPARAWLFPILSIGVVCAIAACFVTPVALAPAIALLITNIAIEVYQRRRMYSYLQPLRSLGALMAAGRIAAAWSPGLARDLERLRTLRRTTGWLSLDTEGRDDPVSLAVHYLNMFLLADVNAFAAALATIARERDPLRRLFEAVGDLDVAFAVAGFRRSVAWTQPSIGDRDSPLIVDDACHPLVVQPVGNSIVVERNSVLVTGSNMSGKTTFLRTIAVNAVLAQTIHTVCAARWSGPPLDVVASIGRSDDLVAGKSYYLAEVERVRELAQRAGGERRQLFVIDELFRGTNALERIAASAAILEYLARFGDIVLVATHDLELGTLLRDRFEAYHFRELVEGGRLTFDYRLQRGISSTRNAIAILDLMEFPAEIVRRAEALVEAMEARDPLKAAR